jgi:hypothetical protein
MKGLVAALALVAVTVAPALAQSPDRKANAQIRPAQAQRVPGVANQYGRSESRHSTNRTHDVYGSNGRYVGSDPDSVIRMDLLRDHGYDD